MTTLDLWLLVLKYKIPTIFICQKWILQTKYEKREFLGYGNMDDKFAFIVLPGFRPQNIPVYKLIQTETKDIFIPLNKLNDDCIDNIRSAINNTITVSAYLESFEKVTKTNYDKKKPVNLIIQDEPDEQPEPPKKRKAKFIIEPSSSVSEEEIILPVKKKLTKKVLVKGEKNKTAKLKLSKSN